GDLAERRVRLLRGGRGDARADAALLRGSRERRGLGLRGLLRPALANQLIDGGHPETRSPLAGRMQTGRQGEPQGSLRAGGHGTETREVPQTFGTQASER